MKLPMGLGICGTFGGVEPFVKKTGETVEGMYVVVIEMRRGARVRQMKPSFFDEDWMGDVHPIAQAQEDGTLPPIGTPVFVHVKAESRANSAYVNYEPIQVTPLSEFDGE